MTRIQKIVWGVLALGIVGLFCLSRLGMRIKKGNEMHLGILQTVSHPALDAVRKGFIDEIRAQLDGHVHFLFHNGEGSMPLLQQSAQQLAQDQSVAGVLAIATPAAQTMHTIEKNKPIAVSAVTDPHAMGMIYEGTNVVGSSDMIDVSRAADMIIALVPTAKVVSLLFNTSEINSQILVDQMKKALTNRTLSFVEVGVTSEADMISAARVAAHKGQVIWCPTDNTVATTVQTIASIARAANIPLFVSDNMLMNKGPFASIGVDYYESGKQAAGLLLKVLRDKERPDALEIVTPKSKKVLVNQDLVKKFNITLPASIVGDIQLIDTKET